VTGMPGGGGRCRDMDIWPELPPGITAALTILLVLAMLAALGAWVVRLLLGY